MDRKIVYPAEVPLSADFLSIQRNTLIALAYDIQSWGGTGTIADGLTCIPTVPASLAVQVTPGSLCQLTSLDGSAYGSLSVDTTHQVMQQGILLDSASLTLVPPSTSGQAINYLIQVQFQQSDTDAAVLAYFNSQNPAVPFMGPGNSGTAQTTTRKGIIAIQAKAGVAATSGSQVTPSPDAGWTGLYVVTVANGATALTSAQISQLSTAPFLSVKLPQVPTYVQHGAFAYGVDAGTANAVSVTLNPTPTDYPVSIYVKKIGSANTGAMTVAFPGTGLGTVSIINPDATAITNGEVPASFLMHLVWDGTSYRLMNTPTTSSVGSLTASSGEGVTVDGSAHVSLNFPGLTSNASPATSDIFGYFSQGDTHHRSLTFGQLLAALFANSPGALLRSSVFSATGTWTKGANTKRILAIGLGAGGAGGSNEAAANYLNVGAVAGTGGQAVYTGGGPGGSSPGYVGYTPGTPGSSGLNLYGCGGGGAGGGFLVVQDVTAITTIAITVGVGGGKVANSKGNDGSSTSLGALAAATGGIGGNVLTPNVGVSGQGGQGGVGSLASGVLGVAWTGDAGGFGFTVGGPGGSVLFGGGGVGAVYATSAAIAGINGSGGGGGALGVAGAKGGDGMVLILEFA